MSLASPSSISQPQQSSSTATDVNGRLCPEHSAATDVVSNSKAVAEVVPSQQLSPTDPWHWWNRLRCFCSHNSKLGVILEIPAVLPPQECIDRWTGEPVRAVLLSTKVFQTNKRGYPALSKAHQAVLTAFFQLNVQVRRVVLASLQQAALGNTSVSLFCVQQKCMTPTMTILKWAICQTSAVASTLSWPFAKSCLDSVHLYC